jgi:ubiquitin C-terminal hydrolase
MKGTRLDGTYAKLFVGKTEQVIQCTNVKYSSNKFESFTALNVPLQESQTIEQALKSILQAESLEGDNAYDAG